MATATAVKLTAVDKRALKFLKANAGEKVGWTLFSEAVKVTEAELGPIVQGLLENGVITEPGGAGSMVYAVEG